MISSTKEGQIDVKSRAPAYAEDLDRFNEQAKNITGALTLGPPCHKAPVLVAIYIVKEKAFEFRCPTCRKLVAIVKVAERGSSIVCATSTKN